MSERVIQHPDGTTERVTESSGTTVVERGGGGGAAMLIGLAVLILIVIGAFYLINQNRHENVKTDAVTQAAQSVGAAADKVGDSAQKAAEAVTNQQGK
jgi:hypothetical protein